MAQINDRSGKSDPSERFVKWFHWKVFENWTFVMYTSTLFTVLSLTHTAHVHARRRIYGHTSTRVRGHPWTHVAAVARSSQV